MFNTHKDFEKLEIPLAVNFLSAYKTGHRLIRKFPKFERYALGERIENALLEGLELVFVANNSNKYEKDRILLKVNAKIELLKLLYRLALDCSMIEQFDYLKAQKELQVMGKMTWGWIKFTRGAPAK